MKVCRHYKSDPSVSQQFRGFVLVEMLMVVGILALMTAVSMIGFTAMWGNMRFKRQAEQLVNVFQMAYNAAAETGRRYEVVLYRTEQAYLLREFTGYEVLEDALYEDDPSVIQTGRFNESITLVDVFFDYYSQEDMEANLENVDIYRFLVGRAGWQAGGKVVLLDEDGLPWTIVVHRFATPVKLIEGEVDIYVPQTAENVRF